MKKIYFAFITVLLLKATTLCGQENLKIGHINSQEIIQQLPVNDSIQQVLNKEADEVEKMYNEMITEHEANLKKFEAEKSSYSEFVRNSKENDLMETATKIQQYPQNANQQLQKMQVKLYQPVQEKIKNAIEKVSLQNNFTYVLDLSSGAVVFFAPSSKNLNALVLNELGITNH